MVTGDVTWGNEPSKRQRLAAELRRTRELAGISGRELAQRIGISQSKVSRIESAAMLPSAPEVTAWGSAVGAPPEAQELLAALTEAAFTEVHNWGAALRDRPHIQGDIQKLEQRARRILTFQPSVVPGLLQTAEYARRIFAMFQPPYREREIPEALASRLDRQLALFSGHQKFDFLITEAALRWRPGPPALLRAQLDRIASLSTLDSVSIRLIPHSVEAVANTSHGFILFEMAEGDDNSAVVMVETIHANLVVNDPESVALYRTRWSLLEHMAISGDEARNFLSAIADDIKATMKLIQLAQFSRAAGDAVDQEGALHPRAALGGSAHVEFTSLYGDDELPPFRGAEHERRPFRVLRVAHHHDLCAANLHACPATFAGTGKADHLTCHHSVHRISLPHPGCGVPAPRIRNSFGGFWYADWMPAWDSSCSFPVLRAGGVPARVPGARQRPRRPAGLRMGGR